MRELLAKTSIRYWLAVTGSCTLVLITAYAMVQQSTRQSANDLPIATAQTIKNALESGTAPTDVVSINKIDPSSNNNVFVIVTDSSRHVLASSVTLDSQTPLPPDGVFQYTSAHGTDRLTWQPKTGVRIALFTSTYGSSPNNGFIITGQSLKPFEDRTSTYGNLAIIAWFAILAWTTFTLIIPTYTKKP